MHLLASNYLYFLFRSVRMSRTSADRSRTIIDKSPFGESKNLPTSYLIKSLIQISYDVFCVLNASRDPHQAVGYSDFQPHVSRHYGMGHRGRMLDQRVSGPQADRQEA